MVGLAATAALMSDFPEHLEELRYTFGPPYPPSQNLAGTDETNNTNLFENRLVGVAVGHMAAGIGLLSWIERKHLVARGCASWIYARKADQQVQQHQAAH